MSSPAVTAARVAAPDLARGFMLMLIALANVPAFTGSFVVTVEADSDPFSRVMHALTVVLADGRAYPLFAMLFGFGIAVLTDRKVRSGATPAQVRRYLVVRMLWLLAFGFVHGLFFPGDILGAYALAGLIAVPLVLARDWVVWLVAGIAGFVWVLANAVTMIGMGFGTDTSAALPDALVPDGFNPLLNAMFWALGTIGAGLFVALAPILLGLLIGRHRWLSLTPQTHRRARLLTYGALAFGLVTAVPAALAVFGVIGGEEWWTGLARFTGPVMAVGYLGVAALVGYRWARRTPAGENPAPGPIAGALVATGRRSLTSYLLQTVLFILVLVPWGPIGLADHASTGLERAVGIGVWLVTVVVAVLLAGAGRPGPADALFRRLSNGRQHRDPVSAAA